MSTSLSNCYVIQKTTEPDGEITFQCLGEDLDVQVTNTQSAYILSISLVYPSHLLSQAHTYYVDAHFHLPMSLNLLTYRVLNLLDQGWLLLSYAFNDPEAFQCDTSVRRTKIFFFCSRGAGLVSDQLFIIL